MPPAGEAVRASKHGVLIELEVVPGAAEDVFPAGFNEWRGRVQARVRAQALEGEANRALCELVAARFDVRADAVEVVSGARDRRKTVLVRGVELATARGLVREGGES